MIRWERLYKILHVGELITELSHFLIHELIAELYYIYHTYIFSPASFCKYATESPAIVVQRWSLQHSIKLTELLYYGLHFIAEQQVTVNRILRRQKGTVTIIATPRRSLFRWDASKSRYKTQNLSKICQKDSDRDIIRSQTPLIHTVRPLMFACCLSRSRSIHGRLCEIMP